MLVHTYTQILDALLESGNMLPEAADAAKSRYYKLHKRVLDTMSNEKALLDQARTLKRRLDVSVFLCVLLTHKRQKDTLKGTARHRTRA